MRRFRGRRMFNSLAMLAVEANQVVGLRIMKLMRGGRGARREAKLMISEKIDAAAKAGTSLMAGASGDEIVVNTESGWRRTRSGWARREHHAGENNPRRSSVHNPESGGESEAGDSGPL